MGGSRLLPLLMLVLAGGCTPQPAEFHVQGTVTFQGKPVPAGIVFFDPDAVKKNDGPQGFATIKEGKFDTRESQRPVGSGAYIARISGFEGKPKFEQPYGDTIFREYHLPVDLPAKDSTHDIVVPETPAGR